MISFHNEDIRFIRIQIQKLIPINKTLSSSLPCLISIRWNCVIPFATNPSSTIYGMAFFEAANGWYDYKTIIHFRLRRSVGVGMRFFLPMFGLLGFDYGIGFDRMNQVDNG